MRYAMMMSFPTSHASPRTMSVSCQASTIFYNSLLNFLESFLILRLSSLCEICSKNRRILCFNFFPSPQSHQPFTAIGLLFTELKPRTE